MHIFNTMITMLMVKFMLNDVFHATGFFSNPVGSQIVLKDKITGDEFRYYNPNPPTSSKVRVIAKRLASYLSDKSLGDFSFRVEENGSGVKLLKGIHPVKLFQYAEFMNVADLISEAATRAEKTRIPKLVAAAREYDSLARMASYVDINTLIAFSSDGEVVGAAFASLHSEETWGKAWEVYGIFSFSRTPGVGEALLKKVTEMAKAEGCVTLQAIPEVPESLSFFKRFGFSIAPGEENKPLGKAVWIKYIG